MVFLDMDGLLADLFNTVSYDIFGQDYKSVTSPSNPKAKENKEKIREYWTNKNKFVERFGPVEPFFEHLLPFGKDGSITNAVVKAAVDFAGEYNICSHPASINPIECRKGKEVWIKRHLNPQPKEAFFPQDKSIYAVTDGKPNILVDDFPPYIQAWRNKGGYAIEMRTENFSTPNQAYAFLTKELEKAKKELSTIKESKFNFLVDSILSSI